MDRQSVTGSFAQTHIARYGGSINAIFEMLFDLIHHLQTQIGTAIVTPNSR